MTIIGTATPSITTSLGSLGDIGWLGSAYFLAAAASQLVFGTLNRIVPHKYVYVSGVFIFEVGCLVTGLAQTAPMSIVGRALSGLGCSGVVSTSFVLVTQILPPSRKPFMIGALGSMELIGQVTGPLIGGALIDNVSWRWCFLINVPLGVVAGFLVFFLLPSHRHPWNETYKDLKSIDIVGIVIMVPATALVLFVIQSGGVSISWGSPQAISMLTIGLFLFVVFGFWEHRKGEAAMLPLVLLKNRSVAFAALFAISAGIAVSLFDYYVSILMAGSVSLLIEAKPLTIAYAKIPLWNQTIKGFSAQYAGVLLVALVSGSAFGVLAGGLLANTIGYANPVMILGGVLTSIAAGLFSSLNASSSVARIVGYSTLAGIGALATQQPVVVAHDSVHESLSPTAISIMLFSNMFGSAISLAISQAVFLNELRRNLGSIPGVDADAIMRGGATQLRSLVKPALLPLVLERYNSSIIQVFYMPLAVGIVMIVSGCVVKWKRILDEPPRPQDKECRSQKMEHTSDEAGNESVNRLDKKTGN
ncbi:MFS multidrug transporter [Apiospora kogelbergensis]|uniref:MFS multidrug transporter n=2 Tax=Apiospora kogelbergensis TaxID=1337665 RepID=A0AAW0RA86_9PEZI